MAMAKLRKMASMFLIALVVINYVAICDAKGKGKEWQQHCQKQIEKQQEQLSSCQQYLVDASRLMHSSSSSSSSRERARASVVFNKGSGSGSGSGSWREEFPKCCDQLEQLDSWCRCQAISQIVEKQMQQRESGELEQEVEVKEMLETAQSLPNLCRLKPKYCDVAQSADADADATY